MYLQTWRVPAQTERARSKTAHDKSTRAPFRHITTNTEMLKQTNKERKATQDVPTPRRKTCNVGSYQAMVRCSCFGIVWQSRFAPDLQVSRSVFSAEHGSRQLSWRTRGLTSLEEATGAFRCNTVYHVTSSTKSDGVSEPAYGFPMHRRGKNK